MTKNILTYAVLALFTLGLNACSQEDDFAPQGEPQEITILTRTATATEGEETISETFTSPFTLELWNDGTRSTHQMTYTESSGYNLVKVDNFGTTVNALAYCGNTVTVTSPDNYTVELTADQSTEDAFNAADVMIATGTFNENGALSLNFEHFYAKVTFNVTLASEFEETVTITNFNINTVDNKTVSAYINGKTVSAIIPAAVYQGGGTFLNVTVGSGTPLEVKVPTDGMLFTAGNHYTFNLRVGKNMVTINQLSIDGIGNPFNGGWNTDSETDL